MLKIFFLLGSLVVAITTVFIGARLGRGSVTHFIVCSAFGFWLALALAALGGVFWAWAAARHDSGKPANAQAWCALTCLAFLFVALGGCASYSVGMPLARADIEEAFEFSERAIPRLESYREEHGEYPENIDAILEPGEQLPRLFTDRDASYVSSPDDFFLINIAYPSAIFDGMEYDSSTATWSEWD